MVVLTCHISVVKPIARTAAAPQFLPKCQRFGRRVSADRFKTPDFCLETQNRSDGNEWGGMGGAWYWKILTTSTGWWFGTWILWLSIYIYIYIFFGGGNVIIPTDFHSNFFGGVGQPPTSQSYPNDIPMISPWYPIQPQYFWCLVVRSLFNARIIRVALGSW